MVKVIFLTPSYHQSFDRDKKNPKVLKYLEDENTYTDVKMKHTAELQVILLR
jgi:protease II